MKRIPIIGEGYRFILIAFFIAIICCFFGGGLFAIAPAILGCYFIYFFRNPKRRIPKDEELIISPADGIVKNIEHVSYHDFIDGPGNKIVIFMSVFNVHVNRSPIEGTLKYEEYISGKFKPAYKNNVGFENERHIMGIENNDLKIIVTQIAGMLAKRIVSWVTVGDELSKGELFGMIKFGSCVEIILPEKIEIPLKIGDKVKGGISIIGKKEA